MALIAILIFLCSVASKSVAALCPLVFAQKEFNITKYAGLWYEAYRHDVNEVASKCENGTYTANPNGTMSVWSQGVTQINGYYSHQGLAELKKASEPAEFLIHYTNPTKTVKYNVITTDYNQYSLVYSCDYVPIVGIKFEHIWFLSRTKTLSAAIVEELKKVLKQKHIEDTDIKPTEQDC